MSKTKVTKNKAKITGTTRIVSIDEVRPNTFNYNKQSAFIYEKMLLSLQEFGFVDPIDVRSSNEEGPLGFYEVIGGEHRLKAAQSLNYSEVPINDLGMLTDFKAKKLCIVLNETKGQPDNDALALLITDLSNSDEDLEVLPFEQAELDAFVEMTDTSFDNLDDDEDLGNEDLGSNSIKPENIIGIMGLLGLSKNKEAYLIAQFRKTMNVMRLGKHPIRCLEKMMDTIIDG